MKNSMLKVFYGAAKNKNILIQLINSLKKEYNWIPKIITLNSEGYKKYSSEAILSDTYIVQEDKIREGDFSQIDLKEKNFIDLKIIDFLKKYETNILSWFQDSTGWKFSFHQRQQYYYDLIKFWTKIIDRHKPGLYLSLTWPHMPSDYILYILLKKYYNIPVIFLDPVPHFNLPRFTIGSDLHDLSKPFNDTYLNFVKNGYRKENQIVENYLKKMSSKGACMPVHAKNYYDFFNTKFKNFFLNYAVFIKKLLTLKLSEKIGLFIKSSKKAISESKISMSFFDFFIYIHYKVLKNLSNKFHYKKLTSKFNLNSDCKFILFLDSYQPEAISNPLQNEFENHIIIIENILAKLPYGYKLIYKEHPGIFMPLGDGYIFRNKSYYHRLKKYKQVEFAPVDFDTYDLIDKSLGIATSGGTGGWEALIRGKKVLSFGNSWYNTCKGVYKIKESKDLEKAINDIINMQDEINFDDVRSYAYSIYENTFDFDERILPSKDFNQNYEVGEEKLKDLAQRFFNYYNNNFQK